MGETIMYGDDVFKKKSDKLAEIRDNLMSKQRLSAPTTKLMERGKLTNRSETLWPHYSTGAKKRGVVEL
jgi:hypothetical protein